MPKPLYLVLASLPLLLMAPEPKQARPKPATVRAVEFIAPGTVVERAAPKGWSHLVLKSQPSLPEAQRKRVSDMIARLATMVFTTTTVNIVADGTGDDRRYRLERIGVGVGVTIDDKDVIVSPDTQAKYGANLGLLARQVLAGVYDKQKEIRLVAVGQTMAIMDTPLFMPRGKAHAAVVLRYVFLVDAKKGDLETLVWRIDTNDRGAYEGTHGMIEWLPSPKFIDAKMQVDLNEFRLGIPSEKAFAVTSVPEGQKQFTMPEGLREIAGTAKLTGEQAGRLGAGMRELVRAASKGR